MSAPRRPAALLVAFAAVTLLLVPHARQKSVDNRLEENVLDDGRLAAYREFIADFGNDRVLVASLRYERIDADLIRALHRLERSLLSDGLVDRVISPVSILRETFALDDPDSLEVWLASDARVRNYAERMTRYRALTGSIVNPETRALGMLVCLSARVGDTDIAPVGRLIRTIEEAPGLAGRIAVTGIPEIVKVIHAYTLRDNRLFTPATLLLIVALLAWLYRSPAGVLLPLFTVLMPMIWTLGLHNLLGNRMNFITAMVPPLVLSNVLTGCIHLMTTVCERSARAGGFRPEIAAAVARELSGPILLCQTTTMIGFVTLAGNGIGAIRTYGLYAGFGVMAGIASTLLFLPAGLALFGARGIRPREFALPKRLFLRGADFAIRRRRAIIFVALALAAAGCAGVARLGMETSLLRYLPADHPLIGKVRAVERDLYGIVPVHLVVAAPGGTLESTLLARDHALAVARFQERARRIADVDAAVSYVDLAQDYDREFSGEPDHLPPTAEEILDYLAFYLDARPTEDGEEEDPTLPDPTIEERLAAFASDSGESLLWRFISRDFRRAHVALRVRDVSSRRLAEVFAEIERAARETLPPTLRFHLTGRAYLWAVASEMIVENQIENFFWSLLFIYLAVAAFFRSALVGLLALPPNVLPILLAYGAMGGLAIPVNTVTGILACVALGMAVDDTIHYLHTLRRRVAAGSEYGEAIRETLEEKGASIVFTSLVISLGFVVLMLSEFVPTFHFGLLVSLTFAGALLLELLLTPALAYACRPFARTARPAPAIGATPDAACRPPEGA